MADSQSDISIPPFKGRLVGVSKKAIIKNSPYVNVIIPWKDSRIGLGRVSVPEAEFEAANTEQDMRNRNSYHIPLSHEEYGVWYIDKDTGQQCIQKISAQEVYELYERNRAEFKQKNLEQKEESASMDVHEPPVSKHEDLDVTEDVPNFSDDLSL